jgi:hypothetical protein
MSNKPTTKKKSPLSNPPLRQAGQGLVEMRDDLINDKILPNVLAPIIFLMIAALQWLQYFIKTPPQPWIFTALALVVTGISVRRLRKLISEGKNLSLAIKGEKIVSEELGELVHDGAKVFHDLQGDGFNLDHVIVSDRGIFTVETKTYRKPAKGTAVIRYDGERLWKNGVESRGDMLTQARAQRHWLRGRLKESTGKELPVRPLIVFPGWYVERTQRISEDAVAVLNPKMVRPFINSLPPTLSPDDVQLAAYHTTQMIRSTERD